MAGTAFERRFMTKPSSSPVSQTSAPAQEPTAPEPTAKGVRAAAGRIEGIAVRTPLIENARLNERVGARVFLKAEVLQRGGSFKLRGAYNLLSRLPEDSRARGVVAWSSGNHAQGVAIAAREFGCPAVIVMPQDAPAIKTAFVRALGAEIVFYDRYTDDREKIGMAICAERNMTLAPSYDHPDIIEGQGTLALEAVEQARAAGAQIDQFVICCGGGGMTAGCSLILADEAPDCAVWIAEPEGFDEAWASIRTGAIQRADVTRRTICDAIATPAPGALTFPVMRDHVKGGVGVSEDEVRAAMVFAFMHLKLVVEPGGAAALAAVLSGKVPVAGEVMALTLSGGNVDPGLFAAIIAEATDPAPI